MTHRTSKGKQRTVVDPNRLTPTQRIYLETARDLRDGELRWLPQSSTGGSILRMVKKFEAAGLVSFVKSADKIGWFITEQCRELLEDLPPIKRKPSYRPGGPVSAERFK